jgi:hypothetical protein
MNDMQLSPEELQLIQIARRLGLVGSLLDKTRQAEQVAKRRAAEEKAATLAYQAYQNAVKAVGTATDVTVTVQIVYSYGDGEVTAVYPPHPSRSQARARGKDDIDQLIEALQTAGKLREASQAIIRRMAEKGGRWQGLRVALRSAWARELAKQFLPADASD